MMPDDQKPAVVLLVEDEALVRMFADEVLAEDGGFKVIATANADEAITILRVRTDVRVLFTDVNMPGSMDGLRLAHAVHAQWPGIAILVTSGLGLAGPLPPGARYLAKPYPPLVLVETIRALLKDGAAQPIIVPQAAAPDAPARAAPDLPRPIVLDALLARTDEGNVEPKPFKASDE